jgi:dienelactone hydrolase
VGHAATSEYTLSVTIPPGRIARASVAGGVLLLALSAVAHLALAAGQTLREVVFTEYGELSSNTELVRRLLSPLAVARLEAELKRSGQRTAAHAVNLAEEKFVVYIPSQRRAGGFGLLVFVPPWEDARIPQGWAAVLDRFGVIFASAARSGNAEDVLGRREPLALLAAENIVRQYPVDAERVYIGGFSGGSRIALRLALAYPDLFRGAILNAGSDPIGTQELALPPRELLFKFQSSTRLVYLTGERDTAHAVDDQMSLRSLHQWCVFSAENYVLPRVEHEVAPAEALARALGGLLESAPPDPARLASCRSKIETELAARLQEVESLTTSGRRAEAEKLLKKIDERFGGLAAPRSVELAGKL